MEDSVFHRSISTPKSMAIAAFTMFALVHQVQAACTPIERAEMVRAGMTGQEVRSVCDSKDGQQDTVSDKDVVETSVVESPAQPPLQKQARIAPTPMPKKQDPVFKHIQLGIASYATSIAYDSIWEEDDAYSGIGFFGTIAINDNIAIRGLIADQTHADDSSVSVITKDVYLLLGAGLATEGGKLYLNIGRYNERWSGSFGSSANASGTLFGFGLGRSWNALTLDFWLNFRSTDDYEKYTGVEAASASAALALGLRF